MPDPLDPSSDSGENPTTSRDTSPDPQDSAVEEKVPKSPIDHDSAEITEARTGKRSREELMQQDMLSFRPAPPRAHMQQILAPRITSFPTNPLETVQEARPMDAEAKISATMSHGRNAVAEVPSLEEFSRMSRSERKKFREKKRRSDVNKGFDELMSLLVRVDPAIRTEMEEQERGKKNFNKTSHSLEGDNLALNRVDLISRTVTVIARMHRQNEDQKALIAELTQGGGRDSDAAAARQAIKDNRVSIPRVVHEFVCCAVLYRVPLIEKLSLACVASTPQYDTGTDDDSVLGSTRSCASRTGCPWLKRCVSSPSHHARSPGTCWPPRSYRRDGILSNAVCSGSSISCTAAAWRNARIRNASTRLS